MLRRLVAHNFAYLPLWNVANSESRGQQTCLLSSLNVERPIICIWAALPQRPITIYATMRHTRSFIVSTLFAFASAQVRSTSKFTNPWLTAYVVGTTYQISWTVGDDRPVSLTISNSTWGLDLACEFENSSGEPFFFFFTDSFLFSISSSTDGDFVQLDGILFTQHSQQLRYVVEPKWAG